MTAQRLRAVDKAYYVHMQAWANQAVKATKGKGKNIKPLYKSFDDFFDYEEQRRIVLGEDKPQKVHKDIRKIIADYNKRGG